MEQVFANKVFFFFPLCMAEHDNEDMVWHNVVHMMFR